MRKLQILQHTLGVDEYGQGRQYRNYFTTSAGHSDLPDILEMVDCGLMAEKRISHGLIGEDGRCFSVTTAGKVWMAENSPAPPKLTRGQLRYQDFLNADCGLSFGEWIGAKPKTPAYLRDYL